MLKRPIVAIGPRARVALIVVGSGLLSGCGPGAPAPPSPMPSTSPTEAPSATPALAATPFPMPAEGVPLAPGTYTLISDGYRYSMAVVSDGWLSLGPDFGIIQGDNDGESPDLAALAVWDDASFVYLDPCHWPGTERSTGTSPEEWVAAIGEVDELRPTTPTDISVDSYPGKRTQISVSADLEPSLCAEGEYRAYEGRVHLRATQVDDLWIVAIPGGDRRVIVTSHFPGTPQHLRDELEEMVRSMVIEPG